MLYETVPIEVKELCGQDSIAKNFRVHFPNSEFRDLINADIVSESPIFTESVGSTTGLKFGLCEGSTLEFQTYFNENIKNLKIEASLEVDVSSIKTQAHQEETIQIPVEEFIPGSYAGEYTYITQISGKYRFKSEDFVLRNIEYGSEEVFPSNTGYYNYIDVVLQANQTVYINIMTSIANDSYPISIGIDYGENIYAPYYAETSSDVPYPFYRIPYGVFYVDSCKRDMHNKIRKIVAYQNKWDVDKTSHAVELSTDEIHKMCQPMYYGETPDESSVPTYKLGALKFLASCLNSKSILETYEESEITDFLQGGEYGVSLSTSAFNMKDVRSSVEVNGGGDGSPISFKSEVDGQTKKLTLTLYYRRAIFRSPNAVAGSNGCEPELSNNDVTDLDNLFEYHYHHIARQQIKENLTNLILDYMRTAPNTFYDDTDKNLIKKFEDTTKCTIDKIVDDILYPHLRIYTRCVYRSNMLFARNSTMLNLKFKSFPGTETSEEETFMFYPYMSEFYENKVTVSNKNYYNYCDIMIPNRISLTQTHEYQGSTQRDFYDDMDIKDTDSPKDRMFKLYIPNDLNIILDRHKSYVWLGRSSSGVAILSPIFTCTYAVNANNNAFSASEIFNSWLELQGAYGRLNREGTEFEIVHLKENKSLYPREDLYPLPSIPVESALYPSGTNHTVARTLTKSLWYDDTQSYRHDIVCCDWKRDGDGEGIHLEEIIVDVSQNPMLARDYIHYDISNNYFIKTLGVLTKEDDVKSILQNLANIISSIKYYVTDMEIRALPYMEAGDSILVLTQDSGFIAYCMRHRISGIHALMDKIESR